MIIALQLLVPVSQNRPPSIIEVRANALAIDVAEGPVDDDSPVALEGMARARWQALEQQFAPGAKVLLQRAANGSYRPTSANASAVFEAVHVSLPLEPPILDHKAGTGNGQGKKNIAGLLNLRHRAKNGRPCIVYGLGISDDSNFEETMASTGCETHAFDCTVDVFSMAVRNKHFKFHEWCIGRTGRAPANTQNERENIYVQPLVHVETPLPCEGCTKKVEIVSAGRAQREASRILLDGQQIAFTPKRGINLVTIDPTTQQVVWNSTYDTYSAAERANTRLATDINSLPSGQIVLIAVNDTGLEGLRPNALQALRRLGVTVDGGHFRENYAFVGRVGQQPVLEKRSRDNQLQFKSLAETMRELGHTHVDLLKFDIEGYEWQLFQSEILSSANRTQLPEQMAFELHTRGANPFYVPAELVSSKGAEQVGDLFLSLFRMGYRVISKEINDGDGHCAEFVTLRVP